MTPDRVARLWITAFRVLFVFMLGNQATTIPLSFEWTTLSETPHFSDEREDGEQGFLCN